MPLIKGMGGMGKRTNPLRAFGDGVYLSDYWSNEAPSRHEIRELLEGLSKLGVYQVNYEGGALGPDGTIRFPTNAEPFTWEADAWCTREKQPMKFIAWVRNWRDDGQVVSLNNATVQRNALYCLNFFSMFKGLLLDMQWDSREEHKALLDLLESLRRSYPELSLGLRARRSWLNHPEMIKPLLDFVHDIEVPLYDSTMEGEAYRLWCEDETRRAMKIVGSKHLMLGVPARGRTEEDETLEDALAGLRRGMEAFTPHRVRLCVYREGLASDDDWKVFARDWAH